METAGSTPGSQMLWYTGKRTVCTVKYPTKEYSEEWRRLDLLQTGRRYGTQVVYSLYSKEPHRKEFSEKWRRLGLLQACRCYGTQGSVQFVQIVQ